MITFFFSLHITGDAVIQKPVDIPSEEVFFRSHDNGYWKMQTFLKIIDYFNNTDYKVWLTVQFASWQNIIP